MNFDLKTALASFAPTLATMLAGPMAGTAVAALESALGLDAGSGVPAINAAMQAGAMTPETIGLLRAADLRVADLRGAYLRGADLREANLSGADLSGADLYGADLRGAELNCAKFLGKTLSPKILKKDQISAFLAVLGFKIED